MNDGDRAIAAAARILRAERERLAAEFPQRVAKQAPAMRARYKSAVGWAQTHPTQFAIAVLVAATAVSLALDIAKKLRELRRPS